MHPILGLALLGVAGWAMRALARGAPGFRAGPWPGLTGRGAGVLLVCSAMLLGCELVVGLPGRAWPDLVWLSLVGVVPVLLGTAVVRAPGCASAVCGVYLMGRSLAALVEPSLELPPLLLPGAVACDLVVWLRRSDFRRPSRAVWRRRSRAPRQVTTSRAALGGAAFGVVLALVEPPFAVLLGSDPSGWSADQVGLAGGVAGLACALAGASIEAVTSRFQRAQEIGRDHPD
jgi:hypothetical protein